MSTRNLEVHCAEFGYLYGTIEFSVRPGHDRYRVMFGSNTRGYVVTKRERDEQNAFQDGDRREGVKPAELVEIISPKHWDEGSFISMWQGFAAGFKRGHNCAKYDLDPNQ